MTPAKFADALVGSRFRQPIRDALRLIFVEGRSQSDAARSVGLTRQEVNRAASTFRKRVL